MLVLGVCIGLCLLPLSVTGRSNRARVDCDTLVCENEEDYVLLRVTSQPFQIISRAKLTTNCSVSSYLRCLPGGSEGSTPGSGTPGSNRGGGPRPTRDTGQRSRSAQDRQGTVAPQRPPPASVCGEVSKPLIITLDSIGYPNASDSRRKHIRGLSQISNTNTDCSVLSTIPGSNKDPDSDVPGNEVAALLISRVIIHLPGIGNTSCSMAVDVYLPRENGTLTVGNQIAELSPQIVKFSVNITEPDKCFCRNLSDPTTCEDVMELAIRVVVAGLRHPQKLAEERRNHVNLNTVNVKTVSLCSARVRGPTARCLFQIR